MLKQSLQALYMAMAAGVVGAAIFGLLMALYSLILLGCEACTRFRQGRRAK